MPSTCLKEHIKGHWVMYLLSVIVIVGQAWQVVSPAIDSVSSIASREEVIEIVTSVVSEHASNSIHPSSGKRLDKIEGRFVAQDIKDKLLIICLNPHLRSRLITDVVELEEEYKDLTGSDYHRPSCVDLGVIG